MNLCSGGLFSEGFLHLKFGGVLFVERAFFSGWGGGRLFSEFFGTLASRQVMGISR